MARLEPAYEAYVARIDAERARQLLATWNADPRCGQRRTVRSVIDICYLAEGHNGEHRDHRGVTW